MPGDETIHVRCDEELKTEVRVAAAKDGQSLSEYVRETLRARIDSGQMPVES